MKLPAALVASVLVWSMTRYLPTYFIELRKMEMLEERMHVENARQVALLREMKAQAGPVRENPASNRFY